MGRYRGPSCKICRRNGTKLHLKGARCETAKCAIEKRNFPPGQHGQSFGRKLSEYGRRLREKQKLRFFYGVSERSMQDYFGKATKQKGVTGHNLLSLFERRLDNVVFRAGLADSRKKARQLVRHGHFRIQKPAVGDADPKEWKANVPSMILGLGDKIVIKEKSKAFFKPVVDELKGKTLSAWLNFDSKENAFNLNHLPLREEIDAPVEEQLIVEFYSR